MEEKRVSRELIYSASFHSHKSDVFRYQMQSLQYHLPFSYKSNYTLIFVELLKSYNKICPSATTPTHVKGASTTILGNAVSSLPHTCPNSLCAGLLNVLGVCTLKFSG